MTRKPDWADKVAGRIENNKLGSIGEEARRVFARALRAAYRRGAKAEREACADNPFTCSKCGAAL